MAAKISAWVVGVLVSLLYAWLVVAGIGNIFGLQQMASLLGLGLTGTGWFWLIVGVALPIVVFLLALVTGRRRGAGTRVLVLAAGLALVAAVQLEILHLVPRASFFA